jgi:hypothetical protein
MALACRISDCPAICLDRKCVKRPVLRYLWDSAGSQRLHLFWTECLVLTIAVCTVCDLFSTDKCSKLVAVKLRSLNDRAWTTPTCFARHSYLTSYAPPSSHHVNFRYLSTLSLQFGSSAAQKRKVAVFVCPFAWMFMVVLQLSTVQWETLFRRRLRCTEGWKCLIKWLLK